MRSIIRFRPFFKYVTATLFLRYLWPRVLPPQLILGAHSRPFRKQRPVGYSILSNEGLTQIHIAGAVFESVTSRWDAYLFDGLYGFKESRLVVRMHPMDQFRGNACWNDSVRQPTLSAPIYTQTTLKHQGRWSRIAALGCERVSEYECYLTDETTRVADSGRSINLGL